MRCRTTLPPRSEFDRMADKAAYYKAMVKYEAWVYDRIGPTDKIQNPCKLALR